MTLIEELQTLLEDRVDFIANQMKKSILDAARKDDSYHPHAEDGARTPHKELDPVHVVREILRADPDNGPHLQFLVRMYVKGEFKMEDIDRLNREIANFKRFKHQLAIKDLNSFKSLGELYTILEPFADKQPEMSQKAIQKAIKEKGVKVFIDTPTFKVVQLLTFEASCAYGVGTKWCTWGTEYANAKGMFDQYSKQGPIFVIMHKGRKFQLHVESGQIKDERDLDFSEKDKEMLSADPAWADFLNIMIKKHYFDDDEKKDNLREKE